MHVAVASRRVRFARLWIIALLLLLAGVLLLPKGWLEPSAAAEDTNRNTVVKPQPPKPPEPMTDAGALAMAIDRFSTNQKFPEPIAPLAPDPNAGGDPEPPIVVAPPATVKFLGAIIGSGMGPNGTDLRRAVVKYNEVQKIIGEGEMVDVDAGSQSEGNIKLLSVQTGEIVIDTKGKQETIKLAKRGDAPPVSVQPTGTPTGLPGMPLPPGNPIKSMTPEEESGMKARREKAEQRRGRSSGADAMNADGTRGGK